MIKIALIDYEIDHKINFILSYLILLNHLFQ